ncbi:ZIP family metal transporter [Roseivirga sp.]|uniref:ZIP family metal transporter n=1 Tax=Roseivirga sp. TaxID=1964215 RepID=UPI003B8BFC00
MIINAFILFLSVALPGLLLTRMKSFSQKRIGYFLVFAGAYLFSMTVIHIIPDLFLSEEDPFKLGLYILIGFFLQKILENFSNGVEHGHVHSHGGYSIPYLLIALGLHSFLEGSIMTDSIHSNHRPDSVYSHGSSPKILLGIVMHKIPAALALMALLVAQLKNTKKAVLLLLVFALASPLGLFFSEFFGHSDVLPERYLVIFFAVVAGSFLQISTTIFIESDPHHKLNWKRFSISILGALAAVAAQIGF